MKKIFKLLPAALGLVALTSCSSDDLFGGSDTVDLSDKLVVTVTEEDDAITRTSRDANYKVAYEVGDQLRVYDSKLQAYDNFAYAEAGLEKPTFILSADDAKVAKREDGKFDYAYAVFGSPSNLPKGNVSYAGWKDGYNIALMKIENAFAYKEDMKNTATGDNQVVYKATLPQWGTVTPAVSEVTKTAKSFDTSLRWLTGRAQVVFQNGAGLGVTNVKMTAYRFAAGDADVVANTIAGAGTIWKPTSAEKTAIVNALKAKANKGKAISAIQAKKGGANTNVDLALMTNQNKNLSGWFEAVLDPEKQHDGLRDLTDDTELVDIANTQSNSIEITVADVAMLDDYTNVFYFPVIPASYDVLLFEYSTDGGANYKVLTAYNGEVTRGQKLEGEDYTIQTALVTEYDDVETTIRLNKLIQQNAAANAPSKLIVNAGVGSKVLATSADDPTLYTITLPQLKNNMIIEIGGVTDITAKDLSIVDATGADNSAYNVTFKFEDFKATATKKISINTTAQIVMAGDYSDLTNTVVLDVTKTGGLSLGSADYDIQVSDVNVAAGTVAVNQKADTDITGTLTSAAAVTVTAGDVATLAAANVTVAGGTVITLNQSAAGTIGVTGGTITTANTKGALDVQVSDGTITNLKLADAAGTISMTGGAIANIKKAGADLTADRNIAITTSGDAVINTGADPENFIGDGVKVYKYTYTTTYNDKTVSGAAADAQANIYTAAQLKAVTGGAPTAYTLMTDVTFGLATQAFTSLTLNAAATAFAGNGKTIDKLPAALFATLSTTGASLAISNLKLTNAAVVPAAKKTADNTGYGILTNKISGAKAVTITNVVVNGTLGLSAGASGSKSCNYGMIAGICDATGAVTITDCGVTGTISGNYNLGGYIGLVEAATPLTIGKTAENLAKNMSEVTFVRSFTSSESEWDNAGTYGNFVGSFTANATFVLGDFTNANSFDKFFSANHISATEIAGVEKNGAGRSYVGMAPTYEIGLSTGVLTFGDANSKLYGKYQTDDTTPVNYTMGNKVNIYK